MNLRAPLLAAICAALGVACNSAPGHLGPSDAGWDGTVTATKTIDPSGGSLVVGGAKLTIPPGALSAAQAITMTAASDPTPAGYEAYSPLYRFQPEGLTFAKPVAISIPFAPPASVRAEVATIFWSRSGATGYERLAAKIADRVATVGVTHFSAGFVAKGMGYTDPPDRSCARVLAVGQRAVDGVASGRAVFLAAEDCQSRPLPGLSCTDPATCDFVLEEDGSTLNATPAVLGKGGLQVFVTLLLDVSSTVGTNLGPMVEGAKALVTRLRVDEDLPVQIGIEIFGGQDMSPAWQDPTLDSQQLLSGLDALAATTPEGAYADLYGTLVGTIQRQAQWRSAFEERNAGGAYTRGFVVLFTADPDKAGTATPDDVKAAKKSSGESVVVLALDNPTLDAGALASLTDLALPPSPDASSLLRDFGDLADRIALRVGALYPLAYCSAAPTGPHTTTVKIASANASGEAAAFPFSLSSTSGCTRDQLLHLCDASKQCGGVLCGKCDDRTTVCDGATATCKSQCLSMPQGCGGKPGTNPLGYPQTCEDRPEATLCGSVCKDLSTDVKNCGGCGYSCSYTCSGGSCACPSPRKWCQGACADVTLNTTNCGTCGHSCIDGEICLWANCRPDPHWASWPVPPDSPTNYTNTDETVLDLVTGLTWQRNAPTTVYTPEQAQIYCAGLSLEGKPWRLPSRIELLSIVDLSRSNPAINLAHFPNTVSGRYWSGTGQDISSPLGGLFAVDFMEGGADDYSTASAPTFLVRCVR